MVPLPATSSRPEDSQRQQLPHDWLEAGLPRRPRNSPSPSNLPLPHRILPPCRWTQHNRNARLHHSEQYRVIFLPRNHIPWPLTSGMLHHIHIRFLVFPEILRDQDEIYVHGHQRLQCIYPLLRRAWALDKQGGVSSCAGLLDLQHSLWTLPGSLLRLCANYDV